MVYTEEDMLMLSGIQHFVFCPRQWALIHLEQQWNDNRLTAEGNLLHNNVDNPSYRQKNGNRLSLRSVPIASKQLGLYGVSDVIELLPTLSPQNAITHPQYPGLWNLLPVEYKRGKRKSDSRDEVQLAAQVICLEEMNNINIDQGALFYGETRHREIINITPDLRQFTKDCANEMHHIFATGKIPASQKKAHCRSCSLVDICMPGIENCSSVNSYLKNNLYEETS